MQVADRQRDFASANRRGQRMRREPTPAEKMLWRLLRRLDGFHFRRQLPLGQFVFDFGDHGARLLVEVDGGIHALPEVQARDAVKARFAAAQGYTLLRIPNDHVFGDGDYAVAAVLAASRRGLDDGGR